MSKRMKILAGTLAVVVLAGVLVAGTVLAQEPTPTAGPGEYAQAFIGKVAQTLGLSETEVTDAFTQAATEVIQQAVDDGRITQDQADQIIQRIEEGGFGGFGWHGFGMGHGWGEGNHAEGDHAEGSCPGHGTTAPAPEGSDL